MKALQRLVVVLVMVLALATAGAASNYTILDLATLPEGSLSWAYDINDSGQIVGFSGTEDGIDNHACLWQDGTITDLGTLGGGWSVAYGINDSGQIVGSSDKPSDQFRACLWQDGTITELVMLPGPEDECSEAIGINNSGQIVGWSNSLDQTYTPCLWQDGSITSLVTLGGELLSTAMDINDSGQIVGFSDFDQVIAPYYHAFLWQDGTITDLGTLPGDRWSEAYRINDSGQIVGMSSDAAASEYILPGHACLWQDGVITDLGTLPGGSLSVAYGINDSGQIVGFSDAHACLWQDGIITDLGTLPGGSLSVAYGINDSGQIVGLSYTADGEYHACLWEPMADFWDVPAGFWAFSQIEACYHGGIVTGYPDGSYQPNNPVTRDQMAAYIARAVAGGDSLVPAGPVTPSFSDVPVGHWAYKYIEYAVSQNVVKGYDDGTYQPSIPVTRDQMAVFVARAVVDPSERPDLPSYTPPETASFPDVPTTSWAYKYIEYCKAQDIVQGYADGYHPEIAVTRDQMAVYVARAFALPM